MKRTKYYKKNESNIVVPLLTKLYIVILFLEIY